MSTNKQANRLIHEKSPYLLQHAYNPVNWFPWSDEAFQKAKSEDKPIFLSIGYSTCHWCHVMEQESFEDEEVAKILNDSFISIKVDREERPDIDSIYMSACQALNGHGGWPLTLFLNHDKNPFFAGTYYPKNDRMGYPGFISILESVKEAWIIKRDLLVKSGSNLLKAIVESSDLEMNQETKILTQDFIDNAYMELKYDFDNIYGGFGDSPKFPSPHNLFFLLRYWHKTKDPYSLTMVEKTLDSMYKGGIYDHIGYGFSRYSTDKKWLVPHFEKMLYDNALLTIAYVEAYQATKKEKYKIIAEEVINYVLRDMTSPDGGFYSAEDADSEGVEGKFYVWSYNEIKEILGEDEKFTRFYNITPEGNFEEKNIPNIIKTDLKNIEKTSDGIYLWSSYLENCRKKLFDHRKKRIHPLKDDKILTSWNGLMIAALALAGRVFGNNIYTDTAKKSAQFILSNLIRKDGRLLARYREKEASIPGYLDDYAFFIWGLLELYQTTYLPIYLKHSIHLNEEMIKYFWDDKRGGLYLYGSDGEQLISRPKEIYDGAIPSGNSVATLNFIRLFRLTGFQELYEKAQIQFKLFSSLVEKHPRGHSFFILSALFYLSTHKEVVVVGKTSDTEDMLDIIKKDFRPFITSLFYCNDNNIEEVLPYLKNYKTQEGKPTAYVCENYECQAPITDLSKLEEALN